MSIISLGGGYYPGNITTYLAGLGLVLANPIQDISIMGAVNNPGVDVLFDIENTLDIDVIAGLCPSAQINVYFCPRDIAGMFAGITQAIDDGSDIISISFGSNEATIDPAEFQNFETLFQEAAANQVSVFVASGDNGSYGTTPYLAGDNVDFPSCCPSVTGVCGTTLVAPGNVRVSETVWNNDNGYTDATGGGISRFFFLPNYQQE